MELSSRVKRRRIGSSSSGPTGAPQTTSTVATNGGLTTLNTAAAPSASTTTTTTTITPTTTTSTLRLPAAYHDTVAREKLRHAYTLLSSSARDLCAIWVNEDVVERHSQAPTSVDSRHEPYSRQNANYNMLSELQRSLDTQEIMRAWFFSSSGSLVARANGTWTCGICHGRTGAVRADSEYRSQPTTGPSVCTHLVAAVEAVTSRPQIVTRVSELRAMLLRAKQSPNATLDQPDALLLRLLLQHPALFLNFEKLLRLAASNETTQLLDTQTSPNEGLYTLEEIFRVVFSRDPPLRRILPAAALAAVAESAPAPVGALSVGASAGGIVPADWHSDSDSEGFPDEGDSDVDMVDMSTHTRSDSTNWLLGTSPTAPITVIDDESSADDTELKNKQLLGLSIDECRRRVATAFTQVVSEDDSDSDSDDSECDCAEYWYHGVCDCRHRSRRVSCDYVAIAFCYSQLCKKIMLHLDNDEITMAFQVADAVTSDLFGEIRRGTTTIWSQTVQWHPDIWSCVDMLDECWTSLALALTWQRFEHAQSTTSAGSNKSASASKDSKSEPAEKISIEAYTTKLTNWWNELPEEPISVALPIPGSTFKRKRAREFLVAQELLDTGWEPLAELLATDDDGDVAMPTAAAGTAEKKQKKKATPLEKGLETTTAEAAEARCEFLTKKGKRGAARRLAVAKGLEYELCRLHLLAGQYKDAIDALGRISDPLKILSLFAIDNANRFTGDVAEIPPPSTSTQSATAALPGALPPAVDFVICWAAVQRAVEAAAGTAGGSVGESEREEKAALDRLMLMALLSGSAAVVAQLDRATDPNYAGPHTARGGVAVATRKMFGRTVGMVDTNAQYRAFLRGTMPPSHVFGGDGHNGYSGRAAETDECPVAVDPVPTLMQQCGMVLARNLAKTTNYTPGELYDILQSIPEQMQQFVCQEVAVAMAAERPECLSTIVRSYKELLLAAAAPERDGVAVAPLAPKPGSKTSSSVLKKASSSDRKKAPASDAKIEPRKSLTTVDVRRLLNLMVALATSPPRHPSMTRNAEIREALQWAKGMSPADFRATLKRCVFDRYEAAAAAAKTSEKKEDERDVADQWRATAPQYDPSLVEIIASYGKEYSADALRVVVYGLTHKLSQIRKDREQFDEFMQAHMDSPYHQAYMAPSPLAHCLSKHEAPLILGIAAKCNDDALVARATKLLAEVLRPIDIDEVLQLPEVALCPRARAALGLAALQGLVDYRRREAIDSQRRVLYTRRGYIPDMQSTPPTTRSFLEISQLVLKAAAEAATEGAASTGGDGWRPLFETVDELCGMALDTSNVDSANSPTASAAISTATHAVMGASTKPIYDYSADFLQLAKWAHFMPWPDSVHNAVSLKLVCRSLNLTTNFGVQLEVVNWALANVVKQMGSEGNAAQYNAVSTILSHVRDAKLCLLLAQRYQSAANPQMALLCAKRALYCPGRLGNDAIGAVVSIATALGGPGEVMIELMLDPKWQAADEAELDAVVTHIKSDPRAVAMSTLRRLEAAANSGKDNTVLQPLVAQLVTQAASANFVSPIVDAAAVRLVGTPATRKLLPELAVRFSELPGGVHHEYKLLEARAAAGGPELGEWTERLVAVAWQHGGVGEVDRIVTAYLSKSAVALVTAAKLLAERDQLDVAWSTCCKALEQTASGPNGHKDAFKLLVDIAVKLDAVETTPKSSTITATTTATTTTTSTTTATTTTAITTTTEKYIDRVFALIRTRATWFAEGVVVAEACRHHGLVDRALQAAEDAVLLVAHDSSREQSSKFDWLCSFAASISGKQTLTNVLQHICIDQSVTNNSERVDLLKAAVEIGRKIVADDDTEWRFKQLCLDIGQRVLTSHGTVQSVDIIAIGRLSLEWAIAIDRDKHLRRTIDNIFDSLMVVRDPLSGFDIARYIDVELGEKTMAFELHQRLLATHSRPHHTDSDVIDKAVLGLLNFVATAVDMGWSFERTITLISEYLKRTMSGLASYDVIVFRFGEALLAKTELLKKATVARHEVASYVLQMTSLFTFQDSKNNLQHAQFRLAVAEAAHAEAAALNAALKIFELSPTKAHYDDVIRRCHGNPEEIRNCRRTMLFGEHTTVPSELAVEILLSQELWSDVPEFLRKVVTAAVGPRSTLAAIEGAADALYKFVSAIEPSTNPQHAELFLDSLLPFLVKMVWRRFSPSSLPEIKADKLLSNTLQVAQKKFKGAKLPDLVTELAVAHEPLSALRNCGVIPAQKKYYDKLVSMVDDVYRVCVQQGKTEEFKECLNDVRLSQRNRKKCLEMLDAWEVKVKEAERKEQEKKQLQKFSEMEL